MDDFHRWQQTLGLLCAHAVEQPVPSWRDASNARAGKKGKTAGTVSRTSVIAVERQSEQFVLVSWSDPTRCRYIDQLWHSARSRHSGYCALSGRAIRRGDPIYKPHVRGPRRPANSAEMILAAELDRVVAAAGPVCVDTLRTPAVLTAVCR